MKYPREISTVEKELLFSILPVYKPGYAQYRELINTYSVTGEGTRGELNLFLGKSGSEPDTISPSRPVFALGTLEYGTGVIDLVIHEEINNEIETVIEGDISIVSEGELQKNINYSEWQPGMYSPEKNEKVREIFIKPTKYLLAFAPSERKIWAHNIVSGVNHLIPLSNYYNSLMLLKNERKGSIALNPKLFFDNLELYDNEELVSAFISYNKYMSRVQL